MREIVYKYNNSGLYITEDDTTFGNSTQMKIIVEPHEFSLAIGDEVLRSTSFGGCVAVVSNEGEVVFYDNENNVTAKADKGDECYKQVKLVWEQDFISVMFGQTETVDYYPNCDGEYDRYGKEWVVKRLVNLDLKENLVTIE